MAANPLTALVARIAGARGRHAEPMSTIRRLAIYSRDGRPSTPKRRRRLKQKMRREVGGAES